MLLRLPSSHRFQIVALLLTAGVALVLAGSSVLRFDQNGANTPLRAFGDPVSTREHAATQRLSIGDAFDQVWRRSDGPVADHVVDRTWMWGPAPIGDDRFERFEESPGNSRVVRYFDKSRMEITDPELDQSTAWFVTNGLLVVELVRGRVQTGVERFKDRHPAEENVAGDDGPANGPTYATLAGLLDAPAASADDVITQRIDHTGTVTNDPALAPHAVVAAHRVMVPGIDHQVASPFWAFMQSSGPIEQDGMVVDGLLFENPFYATGYPITEAYWTTVRVAGTPRDVLLQCFERRCLTWTPSNPPGWQVESGNVGRHYLRWRYEQDNEPLPVPTVTHTATAIASATPPTVPTVPTGAADLITIGPGAVDSWMRSLVRDADDRVWLVAMNNNAATAGTGPGEVRVYRATTTGTPDGFEHLPELLIEASGVERIAAVDAAIDGENRLHVVWVDRAAAGQPLGYRVLDLSNSTWLQPAVTIDLTNLSGYGGLQGQGGVSIVIGSDGQPTIAYTVAGFQNHIRTRTLTESGWGNASDLFKIDGAWVWHPALAVDMDGSIYLAAYDATSRTILASRDTGSGWDSAQIVASDVLGPENIDQGPSLVVTPDGDPTVTYLDSHSHLRMSQFDGVAWRDLPLGGDYHTHAPGLGIFADGTFVIAGHNEGSPPTALNAIFGNDTDWGSWDALVQIQADGSQVFRWAGTFSNPSHAAVDLVFFDEDTNDDSVFDDQTLYYLAVPRP